MTHGNRLGDFYFSLLSSEFPKMKSVRNNNSDEFIEKKYSLFSSELGQKIRNGDTTLSQLSEIACEKKICEIPESGRQEKIQSEINRILFK